MIQAIRLPSAQSPFSERRTEQIQNTWLKVSCRNEWRLLVKSLGTSDLNEQVLPRFCGRYSRGAVREQRFSLGKSLDRSENPLDEGLVAIRQVGQPCFQCLEQFVIEEFRAGFLSTLLEQFPVCSCKGDCSSVRR